MEILGLLLLIFVVAARARVASACLIWLAALVMTYELLPPLQLPESVMPYRPFRDTFDQISDIFDLLLVWGLVFASAYKIFVFVCSQRASVQRGSDQADDAMSGGRDHGLWFTTGIIVGFCGVASAAFLFADRRDALLAHIAPILLCVAAVILRRMAPRSAFARSFAATALLTVLLGSLWVWFGIHAMVASGEALAGENPYCIEVPIGKTEYRAVRRKLDLSPLMMRSPCGKDQCVPDDAVLAIDKGIFRSITSWASVRYRFEDRMQHIGQEPACRSTVHFARDLPIF